MTQYYSYGHHQPQKALLGKVEQGCFAFLIAGVILFGIYLLLPIRTNFLILGLDSREGEGFQARSDTIILFTMVPLRPNAGMLSLPRDLWISIPKYGENRINTIHFFAEVEDPGTGPKAVEQVVEQQFYVPIDYYIRIRFDGLAEIVDAVGGIEITFPEPMSGYKAGTQVLDGKQALAFVRDRANSDDFARMTRGQLFIKALLEQISKPANWGSIPAAAKAVLMNVDTDVPIWMFPRIVLAGVRLNSEKLETQVVSRDMVEPFTTAGGAQVLRPKWDEIQAVVETMFKQ